MLLVEQTKIVNGGGPVLLNTAGITGDTVSLKNYNHLTVIVSLAPASGTDTAAITLRQNTNVGNSPANEKALAFSSVWRNGATGTSDALVKTAVTADSVTTSAAAANEMYVIEIDAADLDEAGGFDCVRVNVTDPGAVSTPASVLYILSEPRYAQATPPSAIID